jgi:hypothetical protein
MMKTTRFIFLFLVFSSVTFGLNDPRIIGTSYSTGNV